MLVHEIIMLNSHKTYYTPCTGSGCVYCGYYESAPFEKDVLFFRVYPYCADKEEFEKMKKWQKEVLKNSP